MNQNLKSRINNALIATSLYLQMEHHAGLKKAYLEKMKRLFEDILNPAADLEEKAAIFTTSQ